ncbi:MAG: hypothetical protein ACI9GW_002763 [Halieaceae bacterium]|jgi:hypothetical protein
MKCLLLFLIAVQVVCVRTAMAEDKYVLSNTVFAPVPFPFEFIEHNALVKNVSFAPINALVAQIEAREGVQLQDRGEAHLTILTPPEIMGESASSQRGINYLISLDELFAKFSPSVQYLDMRVICLGRNRKGNHTAYYLVVESPEVMALRREVQAELVRRATFSGGEVRFGATDGYWPHITIGFVGGDVHGVSKGRETCIGEIEMES